MSGIMTLAVPQGLAALYAQTDAERFPASQLAEGLERASSLYYADFKVAIPFGIKAVENTFANARYKTSDYKMVTELAVVMNNLCWEYYYKADGEKLSRYFADRYYEICDWAGKNFTPEQAQFFWAILD